MNAETLSRLLADYSALRSQADIAMRWPKISHGGFSSEPLHFEDATAVQAGIHAFGPVFGWATFASASHWLRGPDDWRDGHDNPADTEDRGPLIACELVDRNGNNLLLHSQAGGWRGALIRHLPEGGLLVDETTLLGRRGAPPRLHYRRYHEYDPSRGLRAVLASLIAPPSEDQPR